MKKAWFVLLFVIMVLQLVAASYFCTRKQGFHYDEYYSYYSTNSTYGLAPGNREWKKGSEIRREFVVEPGEGFQYGKVKLMQTYDVHPPLYYFCLHTVCSFFPGIFSKWFGLTLNLFFFAAAYWLFARISHTLFERNKAMTVISCLLFGFQPGVLSGITFIRMYMLLLVWCLALVNWHIPVWKGELRINRIRFLTLVLTVAAGFLTHYYFAVFAFFAAAFTCLWNWLVRKNLRGAIEYGITVCTGMALAVFLYPASLSHIFRGYRGTEATDAFFDLSNTFVRLNFFTDLMNDSVFGGSLWVLVILLAVLLLVGKRWEKRGRIEWQGVCFLAAVTFGYFVVVAKTALLNAEEANRYELPVYGLWLLLALMIFYDLIPKGKVLFTAAAGVGILACQLFALKNSEVQFLYPQDERNVQWAAEHRLATVVYLYNPNNQWMIWDESEELMQYEEIYFASLAEDAPLRDEKLQNADEIYVYTSRMDEAESLMEGLINSNPGLSRKELVRELLYCDLYKLK